MTPEPTTPPIPAEPQPATFAELAQYDGAHLMTIAYGSKFAMWRRAESRYVVYDFDDDAGSEFEIWRGESEADAVAALLNGGER